MVIFIMAMIVPYFVQAKLPIDKPSDILPGSGNEQPKDLAFKIITAILEVAGVIALLFVIVGGFKYIFSGANEELAESGKKTLLNAIIGVIVIVLSWTLVTIISKALGVK